MKRHKSFCDTLYTHPEAHTDIICSGKRLHSPPAGSGSLSAGGLGTISITNRTLSAQDGNDHKPAQSEQRKNVFITSCMGPHSSLASPAPVPQDPVETVRDPLHRSALQPPAEGASSCLASQKSEAEKLAENSTFLVFLRRVVSFSVSFCV